MATDDVDLAWVVGGAADRERPAGKREVATFKAAAAFFALPGAMVFDAVAPRACFAAAVVLVDALRWADLKRTQTWIGSS